ncbi:light-harvesting protein [Rhodoferax antarcticus]|uniref:Light-harvesting 3 complex alpha chain n=1 Tax=Rhodoferax antarcticus ANT.BR TaxID=1111071 RepID=A0A1Q8YDM0_9BURK|nr:light-harvesting protein [Rhodoferax antarcticus]APW46010.1 light-harvesting protein [Rhodoferax antarcticus]OLP06148.1 light-harvesting 3 complex alpha chain [Rhodoferax antarcticus ANT.BR]
MIYKNMWIYVKPSTGVPLFLAAVAVASFSVHLALAINAPWIKVFFGDKAAVAATADAVPALPAAVVAKI